MDFQNLYGQARKDALTALAIFLGISEELWHWFWIVSGILCSLGSSPDFSRKKL